ncbi:hypothetical protein LB542_15585 [Mesorhizobium sp. BR1-1-9]|uniref:hypothetical protein n=1 Tax=unclassified Mesorhizobium TaxID=325217 RepID=UPI0015E37C35|nr:MULTISPECIES: hypothetical protein [unclassified Mesorhizobium]MBZ9810278.1 hypothetical protein [Mesorhizobium sp. ESP-6-2]MBZ9872277.1 hypothetical protein [Mesorhizobium sp. BR1-1-9]MBZ9943027.1 hypothetical protein [Mesorhizobium sp. BR1-1-13]
MSAKEYAHHQKSDGYRENWREQPTRLANAFIHLLSSEFGEATTLALSRSAQSQEVRPLRFVIGLWSGQGSD